MIVTRSGRSVRLAGPLAILAARLVAPGSRDRAALAGARNASTNAVMSPRRVISLALILLVASCTDLGTGLTRTAVDPSRSISDAVHDPQGNPHFFWLPPLADQPSTRLLGRFESLAAPRVDLVCFETNTTIACDPGESIRTFTLGDGLIVEPDHFKVELHTGNLGLSVSSDDGATFTTYRVLVRTDPLTDFGGPFVLGHADFQVALGGKGARSRTTSESFGLVDGRTLPVRFRIDSGAYAHALKANLAEGTGDPAGELLCQEHCSVTIISPEATTLATLDNGTGQAVTGIQFRPGDLDQTSVLIIDQRVTDGAGDNCATGVLVEKKYCYRYRITPDVPFNNDVRFGICPREIFDREDSESWRLMKVDYIDGEPDLTYPPEVDVRDFLPCGAEAQASLLTRLARFASARLITPLFAQTTTRTWGGMIRDFSDLFWGKEVVGPVIHSQSFVPDSAATSGTFVFTGQHFEDAVVSASYLLGMPHPPEVNAEGTRLSVRYYFWLGQGPETRFLYVRTPAGVDSVQVFRPRIDSHSFELNEGSQLSGHFLFGGEHFQGAHVYTSVHVLLTQREGIVTDSGRVVTMPFHFAGGPPSPHGHMYVLTPYGSDSTAVYPPRIDEVVGVVNVPTDGSATGTIEVRGEYFHAVQVHTPDEYSILFTPPHTSRWPWVSADGRSLFIDYLVYAGRPARAYDFVAHTPYGATYFQITLVAP
jgi:hypothetical protein